MKNQSLFEAPKYQLSLVIPAYREEERIEQMMTESIDYLEERCRDGSFSAEIIVVDDGSPDRTAYKVQEIVNTIKPQKVCVKLLQFSHNQGKGAAVSEVRCVSGFLFIN